MDLNSIITAFENMKMNKHGKECAPHKPLLLLVIIDMIEDEYLTSNIVATSEELESRFVAKWNKYVIKGTSYLPNVWMPYFHLKNEPFWSLEGRTEGYSTEMVTKKSLEKYYYPALIDPELFTCLQVKYNRTILRHVLRSLYFTKGI